MITDPFALVLGCSSTSHMLTYTAHPSLCGPTGSTHTPTSDSDSASLLRSRQRERVDFSLFLASNLPGDPVTRNGWLRPSVAKRAED